MARLHSKIPSQRLPLCQNSSPTIDLHTSQQQSPQPPTATLPPPSAAVKPPLPSPSPEPNPDEIQFNYVSGLIRNEVNDIALAPRIAERAKKICSPLAARGSRVVRNRMMEVSPAVLPQRKKTLPTAVCHSQIGPFNMKAGGQRNNDGVDFWVVKEGLIGAVNLGIWWEVVGFCKGQGFFLGAARDGRVLGEISLQVYGGSVDDVRGNGIDYVARPCKHVHRTFSTCLAQANVSKV
ncbi:unnamed protein product [Dovyalis caffra]|uniref:Uncharacterized protein n=1 Tax=Dovyalis caffra TaxID=77055 RepID=A0AAV1S9V6_9ROSI|nr:unnamed protein product [Dovyalis caffra]